MQLARVTGTVVATVKADGLEGVKFLVVQPLDRHSLTKFYSVIV
jgi:microcompartment protein CcmK/EutM